MKDELERHVDEASILLTEMANVVRLRILEILSTREMDVGALATEIDLSQSALSQHLKRLRDAKLVSIRRDRQNRYYSCKSEAVGKVLQTLSEMQIRQ